MEKTAMNFKDTVSAISAELNIPAKQVRTVASALLERLGESIKSGEGFKSPSIGLQVRDVPERVVKGHDGIEKSIPGHRIGIMRLSKKAEKGLPEDTDA
jgi:nucleoid DNA-binding protein